MPAKDERFFFLVQTAAHRLKTAADRAMLETGGLTTAQTAVMAIVCGEGPLSQREIAGRLKQRESAVGAMAERLLKAGYIARSRSATDRRAWVLTATPAGRRAFASLGAAFTRVNAALDEAFPDKDMERAAKGLRRLMELLEEDGAA